MMISIALLGFGASGTCAARRPWSSGTRPLSQCRQRCSAHGGCQWRWRRTPALQRLSRSSGTAAARLARARLCSPDPAVLLRGDRARTHLQPPSDRRSDASTPATWSAPGSARSVSSASCSCFPGGGTPLRRRAGLAAAALALGGRRRLAAGTLGLGAAAVLVGALAAAGLDGPSARTSPSTRGCRWR